jgi:glutaredoxin
VSRIAIYGRKDCHLCDEAKAAVARATAGLAVEIVEIDVDTDPMLQARFDREVPVVFVDGKKAFKLRVNEAALRRRVERQG